jgi:hypothetical protein
MLIENYESNDPQGRGEELSAFLAGEIQASYAGLRLPGAMEGNPGALKPETDDTDACKQSGATDGNCSQCCQGSILLPCVTNEPVCTQQPGCAGPEEGEPKHHPHHHPHKHASWYDRA